MTARVSRGSCAGGRLLNAGRLLTCNFSVQAVGQPQSAAHPKLSGGGGAGRGCRLRADN